MEVALTFGKGGQSQSPRLGLSASAGVRSERVEQAEEDREGRTPCEQAIDKASPGTDDLRRNEDELLNEGTEVHTHDGVALGFVLVALPRRDGDEQAEP